MKMDKFVLDACALITLLNKESGYEKINDLLTRAELREISVCINMVNLLEVYYDRIKVSNLERADMFLETIYDSYIEILEQQNKEILRNAGILKAKYKISLADSFALSTAIHKQAALITTDHHEFDIIEQNKDINFLWIR
jgi:predicted nucleic acid-binding protein